MLPKAGGDTNGHWKRDPCHVSSVGVVDTRVQREEEKRETPVAVNDDFLGSSIPSFGSHIGLGAIASNNVAIHPNSERIIFVFF